MAINTDDDADEDKVPRQPLAAGGMVGFSLLMKNKSSEREKCAWEKVDVARSLTEDGHHLSNWMDSFKGEKAMTFFILQEGQFQNW